MANEGEYVTPTNNIDPASQKMSDDVDNFSSNSPIGSVDSAISNSVYGINHRQMPGAIQINKDYYGYTFFTRPELNFTSENLRMVRKFAPLLSSNPNSWQRIIRCSLDPLQATLYNVTSPLVDEQQAFIPLLTNHLISINGWPDEVAPTWTSQEGVYKEAISMIDGITDIYSTYDITANFRNIPGDPITSLFMNWYRYSSAVYVGVMVPYMEKIIRNEIDYNTRIYRLVMDHSKRFVRKIGACGAAFPFTAPIGAAFNYESDGPINKSNDQISIPLRCMGAMYQDDILIYEFNGVVIKFNSSMKNDNFSVVTLKNEKTNESYLAEKHSSYTQIPADLLTLFNNRGYPRINPETYELTWWVNNSLYNSIVNG